MLLKLRDIETYYGTAQALKGISLEVKKGELITILGANGAGKTTLLRTISGLNEPRKGTIEFEGGKIDRMSPDDIVKLGISHVPEGRRLFPGMSVIENLLMGAYLRKSKKEIDSELEKVFYYFSILGQRRKQRAGSLSGGEQQMLAIGRALMSNPKLLLLDEPSIGLSPLVSRTIIKIIGTINQEGVSILLVEQNAKLALGLAYRGYVLETGVVVLEGDTRELLQNEAVKAAYLGG